MDIKLGRALAALCCAWLAGCGGGGGGGSGPLGSCQAITGGGTQVSRLGNCTQCGVHNLGAAADGNLGSFATLFHDAGGAGANSLRVTAQEGIVYPAGTPAFVISGVDYEGPSTTTSIVLSSYLDGALQETNNIGSINTVGGPDEDAGRRGFAASQPFDALEVTYQRSGGTGTVAVHVFEFCTN